MSGFSPPAHDGAVVSRPRTPGWVMVTAGATTALIVVLVVAAIFSEPTHDQRLLESLLPPPHLRPEGVPVEHLVDDRVSVN